MVFFYYVKRVSWRTTATSSEGKRKMTLIKPILFFSEIRAVKATPSMMVPHFCQPRGDGHAHIGQHRRCHLACVRETLPCPDISTGREKQYISQNLNGQKSQQCQHLANRSAHTESAQITEVEQLTTGPYSIYQWLRSSWLPNTAGHSCCCLLTLLLLVLSKAIKRALILFDLENPITCS